MAATVNVNGRISGERDATISIFDHGFLYGEGVYETLRTYNGRPFLYDTSLTSSHGDSACASCHIFGDFDSLAWDLGDPDGQSGDGEAYAR